MQKARGKKGDAPVSELENRLAIADQACKTLLSALQDVRYFSEGEEISKKDWAAIKKLRKDLKSVCEWQSDLDSIADDPYRNGADEELG